MNTPDDKTLIKASKTKTQLVVKVEIGNGVTFSFAEDKLPLIVGRGQDCDICIPESHVSRRHCELFLKNGILFLKDTSTNGTMIGEKRVKAESVSIDVPTRVFFTEKTSITVTPEGTGNVIRGTDFSSNRRSEDRRQLDRRVDGCVADFERRSDVSRRVFERRTAAGT